jgi:acetylornithine deacetylase
VTRSLSPSKLLQRMVAFPSVSGHEGDLVEWIASYLRRVGLSPTISGRNLYVILRGEDGPTLLFNTHLDVVHPGVGWSSDPFVPVVKDGMLYARGANDAKGCGAAMITAVIALARERRAGTLILALTCDEETGGEGLEKLICDLPAFDSAVIGEPTFNRPSLGMRGLVSALLLSRGRGCHASRPHEGINPIYGLAQDVLAVRDFIPEPVDPLLGKGTLAVTVFSAGEMSARNRVPGVAEAIVDLRTTLVWDNNRALDDLRSLVKQSEIIVRSQRIKPKATSPDSLVARAAFAAAKTDLAYEFRGASDFAHVAVPGVILGPGNTTSHQPDEHVPLKMVSRAADIYADVARAYFDLASTSHLS